MKRSLVYDKRVSVKDGVGVVVFTAQPVVEPVVVYPGAGLLNAVGFYLSDLRRKTGEVVVRLLRDLARFGVKISTVRVKVNEGRDNLVRLEPVS